MLRFSKVVGKGLIRLSFNARSLPHRVGAGVALMFGVFAAAYGLCPWRFQPGLSFSVNNIKVAVPGVGITTKKFKIINNTLSAISLDKQPGCSCVDMTFSSKQLLPFQTAECTLSIVGDTVHYGVWNSADVVVNRSRLIPVHFFAYHGEIQ